MLHIKGFPRQANDERTACKDEALLVRANARFVLDLALDHACGVA